MLIPPLNRIKDHHSKFHKYTKASYEKNRNFIHVRTSTQMPTKPWNFITGLFSICRNNAAEGWVHITLATFSPHCQTAQGSPKRSCVEPRKGWLLGCVGREPEFVLMKVAFKYLGNKGSNRHSTLKQSNLLHSICPYRSFHAFLNQRADSACHKGIRKYLRNAPATRSHPSPLHA